MPRGGARPGAGRKPAVPGFPDTQKGALAVRYVPISSVVPAARNARTHSPDQVRQIARAIAVRWTNPILVDERTVVIAGHGRLEAAKLLGLAEVPTIALVGLTEPQKRALALADNQLALNAGWDDELLRLELAELGAEGFDISLIGFGDVELAGILADRTEGLTDPDDAPPLPAAPVSVLGDVWLLGRHRLCCGDCTDAAVVARALNGAKPPLMVTDQPWGVGYAAASRARARAVGAVANDDRVDWRSAWVLFPGDVAYVWHPGTLVAAVARSLAEAGLELRAHIVWVKARSIIGRGNYHFQHEPALYVARDGVDEHWHFVEEHELAGYAVREGATAHYVGGRRQSTVWELEHRASETGHSTQKPVECMRRPICNNSVAGEAVYDPFVGSGTTLIAGEMTGRVIHAIEIEPGYVDVGVLRWQAFTGRQATLESNGQTFEAVQAARAPKEHGEASAVAHARAKSASKAGAARRVPVAGRVRAA
jgi:DNA modification methylase